ncbi:hypothetical protein ACGYLO_16630 [Sulfitobacter sp. 1A13353]|uniref:hypothetical protein n=1 Tax=Sulfitobacter sp. 1A13353 TaxID=3368568 RepID=UPI0037453A76
MTEDQAVNALLTPESEEPEAETDEAPQDEGTEAEEVEAEDDAPDVEADDDETEEDDEDGDEADSDEDEDEEEADEDEEQPAESYTVKVDGEEKQVTLDELKRGYSGQSYIQKGMETNKQTQAKLLEAAEAMQQERQQFLQAVQQVQQTGFLPAPKAPSKDLMRDDPIGYMEARAQYDEDMAAYQEQQQQIQYHQQRAEQQNAAMRQKAMQEQYAKLVELVPEFGDAKKAPELKAKLMKSAESEFGFSAQDLEQISDARQVLVLRDALAYRELQKGKQAARQERAQPKAVTKRKAKGRDGGNRANAQKAMQRAIKTQSDDDWVNVLLNP